MQRHEILGGKVQLYRRAAEGNWWCLASSGGQQRRATTKQDSLSLAKQLAEDWYLGLRGKNAAGLLKSEETFKQAAAQFLKEYEVITEGERSLRWTQGHDTRLRVHLLLFFGDLGVSEITPGKVQEYRVERMTSRLKPNPYSKSNRPLKNKSPARSTLHNEIVTLRQVLKMAVRHGWLAFVPDLSPPYKTSGKIVHRPWFSSEEYKQLYKATGAYAKEPFHDHDRWNAEQVHDYVLFLANTGLRPDEAGNLEHRDVAIVVDEDTGHRILEIEVRGERGVGFCKSMPNAVKPYERLLSRPKPAAGDSRRARQRQKRDGLEATGEAPQASMLPAPTDKVFPGNHVKLFNGLLEREKLKTDRDDNARTAYSLRHTYICLPDRRRRCLPDRQELPHQRRDDPEILRGAHQERAARRLDQRPPRQARTTQAASADRLRGRRPLTARDSASSGASRSPAREHPLRVRPRSRVSIRWGLGQAALRASSSDRQFHGRSSWRRVWC